MDTNKTTYNPTLCLTHACNLSCVYCYQQHDSNRMNIFTAKKCIDYILENIPDYAKVTHISFIGGEPLLEFELIKQVYEYTETKNQENKIIFFATTNGTMLTDEMKEWFSKRRERFVLGLSLDGKKETQDYNRSNSFDLIDVDFFLKNWPLQGVKMTISEFSLAHLADNIIYLHSLGFKYINGVNLAEGDFNWDDDKYIQVIIPQLKKLVGFYTDNTKVVLDQTFGRKIHYCAYEEREKKKYCGIGSNMVFFDTDGRRYPCSYITPMTFKSDEIEKILQTDFNNIENFIDYECYSKCYLYPICPTCSGGNYQASGCFAIRNKRKCRILKLMALFVAELHTHRIIKYREMYENEATLYYTIEAIKKIKELYYDEFKEYL